ncbi:hypothetical protein GCM10022267_43600 [Lentzea roselyniae]|uniref:Uncharacterized protein n=1 Tax=Lentzea roselyniae TaxID=531940 RepID=A0ABP7B871_9PSEU
MQAFVEWLVHNWPMLTCFVVRLALVQSIARANKRPWNEVDEMSSPPYLSGLP